MNEGLDLTMFCFPDEPFDWEFLEEEVCQEGEKVPDVFKEAFEEEYTDC